MRWVVALAPLVAAAGWAFAPSQARAAEGLAAGNTEVAQGWRARIGAAPEGTTTRGYGDAWHARSSLSLFGDYYFGSSGLVAPGASNGGFRATSGLFVGPRSGLGLSASSMSAMGPASRAQRGFGLALPSAPSAPYAPGEAADAASVPYVGVGYSGLKALRATGGGWAFSADVGLMALQPRSAVRLGQQPVAETLRDLQLSPLLQVGASYSF